MNFMLKELCELTGGTILLGEGEQPVGGISTDTRTLRPGEVFIALRGPNFLGEEFVRDALAKGAAGVIACSENTLDEFPRDRFFLLVPDTLVALGDVARGWRRSIDPALVAVSGSTGKTTTKEMIAHLCAGSLNILATEGNRNNRVGLPQTLLRLSPGNTHAVVELGMNQPEELTVLTEICEPDIAIVTNVGNAHVGNFGSVEKLIAGEAEVLGAMDPGGIGIINADCPNCYLIREEYPVPGRLITFGMSDDADVQAFDIQPKAPVGYRFRLRIQDESWEVSLCLFGRYQIYNALAAVAASVSLGLEPAEAAGRLASFKSPRQRAEIDQIARITIINDSYNASPDAVKASLRSLSDYSGTRRRIALLGDMLELGDLAEEYHRDVARDAARAKVELLCTVGELARFTQLEADANGISTRHFESPQEAADFLAEELAGDDVLLVKASRRLKLENAVARLHERMGAGNKMTA